MYYCIKPGRISKLRGDVSYGRLARWVDDVTGKQQTTRATLWWFDHVGVKYLRAEDLPRMRALATVLGVGLDDLLDEREPTERERAIAIAEARKLAGGEP